MNKCTRWRPPRLSWPPRPRPPLRRSMNPDSFDEDEELDIESEAEVETAESEGLTGDAVASEAGTMSPDGDGHKRKRRRRRRVRPGEREGGSGRDDHREEHDGPRTAADAGASADETDEDETGEQPGLARADQGAGGERRPRRRGRRGGRRRRGAPDDGLAGSIADELGPTSTPEAAAAVADFDGGPSEQPPPAIQPESTAPTTVSQYSDRWRAGSRSLSLCGRNRPGGREGAGHRRSTVREKVSFLLDAQPATAPPAEQRPAEPATAAPAQAEPENEFGQRKAAAQGRLVVEALRQWRISHASKPDPMEGRLAKPGGLSHL